MFSGLLIILLPLIVGYLIPLRHDCDSVTAHQPFSQLDCLRHSFLYGDKPGLPG